MKSDSFRNNRKALAALLLCTGFIAGHPFAVMADGNEQSTQVVLQQIKVTGVVKDAMGPVAGASVVEKGNTSNGTITDIDGNFSLSVKSGGIIIVSYLGYKTQEITTVAGKSIDVVLKDDTELLDEVVIVGFGTQKKVNLTGSVGIATAKEIESRPVSSAVQALQGVIPGLKITTSTGDINSTMDISVRGIGTIGEGSSGSPLILIDGMEGDLNTVNPQDIENISVLKDAAASSIYGARAPFGVILVTTKSGQQGKTSVNYNNSFRFSSPLSLPESMDSYSWAVMVNQAQINAGGSAYYSNETMQKMLDYQAGKLQNGIDPDSNNPNAWEDIWSKGYANSDLYDETYKSTIFSQEHNLSVSGGSNALTYYVSANYLKQNGSLKIADDGLNRYNVTAKLSAKLTDWLTLNTNIRYTNNDYWGPSNAMNYNYYGRQNWPNIPMYDPNGHFLQETALSIAEGGKKSIKSDRHYYQAALVFEPIKNWVTKAEINYSIFNENTKNSSLPVYTWTPQNVQLTGTSSSTLSKTSAENRFLNINVYSEYSRSFVEAHNFKIMAGFQSEEMKQQGQYGLKYGLLDFEMPEFDLTTSLNGSGNTVSPTLTGYSNEWATVGFFGRFNYDYKGRYLFEANLRYDGSSRFRRDSRWVTSPSFSLGWNIAQEGFWKPISDIVNQLKVRASYGQLANQNTTSWYPTYRTMSLGALSGSWLNANGTRPNTAVVGGLVSSLLTWETVRTWNVGLDWGLFNNRLTGSFDYFRRYTYDMVGPAPELPVTLGLSAAKTNNTDLYTTGWEVSVNWKDRTNFGMNYGINLSLSDQQTYIDYYPGNATKSIGSNGSASSYISGQKIGLIWGYETIGIAKTQAEMDAHLATLPNGGQDALGTQSKWEAGDIMYRDLNGDGKITEGARTLDDHGDLKVLGDLNPHYFIGLDLTADWKGFDLRAFFQGVLDHDYWPGGDSSGNNEGAGGYFWGTRGNRSIWHARGFTVHQDYFRAEPIGLEGHEIPANVDSYYPRPLFSLSGTGNGKNQYVQSRYMQNARYIRLKNLQIGYTLPSSLMNKVGISKCRIFLSGENLVTFTPLFKLFDPETAMGGLGGNAYPLSQTWSFGLSLTL
ncbi:SusC/RagA family TonB-linked outer membrane protein [Bacteroides oleiciplenus]|uniref:SusC/RagA family TonB-linked outer membrane protein n=1 Tax=Bacteroides oleiciplenus YIT 12058 TaxID=742727 RepID=K9DX75_9BACE|nr:TonB-dependent receptor [Bacteroides oleiciplenus]EKU89614.1 SusC/RagA family TonB-linked outer membrane protein [Bacteroides oleiciplenus YIT 12058]